MYQFKPSAKHEIERAGVNQADIAERADYDRHEFNKRLNKTGKMRPATANRVARAFGQLANISQDAALGLLFDEIDVAAR
jgi:hypothetical protein